MKQLLLRVDDELHARLTAQARARGTSVNALANQILGLGIDPTNLSRTDRLRLRLMEIGTLGRGRRSEIPVLPESGDVDTVIDRAIDSMRGAGPLADSLSDYERGDR